MRALSERERKVLCLRFMEDLTQSEIGERVGVSQMQVSRIIRQALERLRKYAAARERVPARESDRVELVAGVPEAVDVARDDGSAQRILRCPECRVAILRHYGRPEVSFVRGGTLDDPTGVTPDVHIYTRSKVRWLALPAGAPAFDGYYDAKQLWPDASLDRLQAVLPQRA